MSHKENDTFVEQRKEAIEEKLAIIEEKAVKDQTLPSYGLSRVMSLDDELDRLNRLGVCA